MGYYIRVLALDDTPLTKAELWAALPANPRCELVMESGSAADWSQLALRHVGAQEIAIIERNLVMPGELGEAEIAEFIEEAKDGKPQSAARWLENFLPRVKAIYAFQLLGGTDVGDGWTAVHALQRYIWSRCNGILQADGEGFTNEDGYHILWQFSDHVTGNWNMAVLKEDSTWTRFQMDLGNHEDRAEFTQGRIPKSAKLL